MGQFSAHNEMTLLLFDIFANLHQSTFLYDDYFDIISVNHSALLLHNIEPV
jgi:hypothetical protein